MRKQRMWCKEGNRKMEEFWIRNGMHQGWLMNPALFNVFIRNLEEEARKEQMGKIIIGKEKV